MEASSGIESLKKKFKHNNSNDQLYNVNPQQN